MQELQVHDRAVKVLCERSEPKQISILNKQLKPITNNYILSKMIIRCYNVTCTTSTSLISS